MEGNYSTRDLHSICSAELELRIELDGLCLGRGCVKYREHAGGRFDHVDGVGDGNADGFPHSHGMEIFGECTELLTLLLQRLGEVVARWDHFTISYEHR